LAATSGDLPARRAQPAQNLLLSGSVSEGGVPSKFRQSLDLATGFTRQIQQVGDSEAQSGFDGEPWDESNGIVMVSNLPSAVAQRRARVWLDQQAWRESMAPGGSASRQLVAPGGVKVTLTFDQQSRRLKEAVVEGDWGPIVYRYGDWRRVGTLIYPFRRESVTPVGEHTLIQIETAKLVTKLPAGSLARPARRTHAEPLPASIVTVPFEAVGSRKSHMSVQAVINGVPARLIFDTGAANYLTTESASRFGVRPSGGVNLSGVGESSETGGYATVGRIALGAVALRDETLVVGPSPFPPSQKGHPPAADGFTGFEFLAEYITTIDYPAQQLHFRAALPRHSRQIRVPFFNDGSHFYVRARLNGVEGYFGVDTGDGGTVMVFRAFAAKLGIESKDVRVANGGVGGAVREGSGVVERFSLGGLEFKQLPVRFSQTRTGAFASRSLAGNLGGAVLRCFRITIDFPSHLLLLDPAPEQCAPGGSVVRTRG
jgi:predicted aspartyl protease